VIGGVELPSYRGDIINGIEFTPEAARMPDPERLLQAYTQSAATLNLLRAFRPGRLCRPAQGASLDLGFVADSPQGDRYRGTRRPISETLDFMAACGITRNTPQMRETDFYTSHEALLLATSRR
jgi:3-deoxy-7-phosphoheptulonate synthase